MSKTYDVVALGELLVDYTENGVTEQGNPLFEANPGGAPCNVLAMLRKLEKNVAFIGKVGNDMFGHQLLSTCLDAGIDMRALLMDSKVHTTLAFVHKLENGDRDFSFYRNPGADMMLRADELPLDMLRDTRIFHFGTLSMTHPGVREATVKAVETAKEAGARVSFDPNLRPPLWDSLDNAREQIDWGLDHADIVKIADNELEFMTGKKDFDTGATILRRRHPNIKLLNVTAGPDGSHAYLDGYHVYVPGFHLGGTIETTGAGDTFCGSVLSYILDHDIETLTQLNLVEMLRFANAAAYLVTTRKGAIRSMPDRLEVLRIL